MRQRLPGLFSLLLLFVIWETVARISDQPEWFPTLPRLLHSFLGLWTEGDFYRSVGMTICRGMTGMLISLLIALPVAWLMAKSLWATSIMQPWLAVMRSVPVISFLLLALIFLQAQQVPLLIAFLTMFPLLTENLAKGFRQKDEEQEAMAHCFRISRLNRLTQIYYPRLKPFLYAGLASATGFGWRAVIMGEVLAQCNPGIGGEMKKAQNFIDVPSLLAWTTVAIGIGLLSDRLLRLLSCQTPRIRFTVETRPQKETRPVVADTYAIIARKIRFRYAIQGFSFLFRTGRCYALTAPSGTGKSTLLKLFAGILEPTGGELHIDRRQGIAIVLQEAVLLPHLTALENVMLPLARLFPRKEAEARALRFLRMMEVGEFSARYPAELSYGQQQRVALARALAYPSPLLLMDEPFKGLDTPLVQKLIGRIREEKESGRTILFTTHHPAEWIMADEQVDLADILRTFASQNSVHG